jgi:hypothetical protein
VGDCTAHADKAEKIRAVVIIFFITFDLEVKKYYTGVECTAITILWVTIPMQ